MSHVKGKKCHMVGAKSEDSDQPAQMCRLIKVLTFCNIGYTYSQLILIRTERTMIRTDAT